MNNPDAITVEYNTEFRAMQASSNIFGIDYDRHQVYLTNKPSEIFDHCTQILATLVQDGMPLSLIIIDSLTFIAGPKTLNADSVEDFTIGDQAAVITKGLQQIIPWIKRNRIPFIATAHMRANIDPSNPRAPKEKATVNFMAKHSLEYFMSFRKAGAADDRVNLAGEEFTDTSRKDIRGNAEITGHKIISKMEESSLGTPGRTGMITLSYAKGIDAIHEEIFTLEVNTGTIKKEGMRTYLFDGNKWSSKMDCALAIRDNPELAGKILEAIRKLDDKG